MIRNWLHKLVKTENKARLRPLVCALAASLLVAGGCFAPNVKPGGFACSGSADGQCPAGFFCVRGFCQDALSSAAPGGTGGVAVPDLSQSPAQDLSMVTVDMASRQSIDMTQTGNISDLARPIQDMASSTGNSCAHSYCMTGSALNSKCDPCVKAICSQWPNCCSSGWIQHCVDDVQTYCSGIGHCP
jgi:hypothetical protein